MKQLRRGTRLGKYRLDARIGRGASAQVWRGRDLVEARSVALKIISPEVADEYGPEEIEREAQLSVRLEHPNILTPRNADWIERHFVLATDLAQRSLDAYAGARRSTAVALRLIRDVTAGLAHAHEHGILHRDIKPANVLVFPGPSARLADFGTARPAPRDSRPQTEAGTLGYMAPEQAYGRPRYESDVFSLGLVAYELLAGVVPAWPFEAPLEGWRRFSQRTPAPVQRVLLRAIEIRSDRRWSRASEMLRALDRALERVQPNKSAPRRRRPRKRDPESPFELEARWFLRTHGKALELRFDCFQCGGPISEAMGVCPWCGTDRNSFIDVTGYPLVCPECERGVRAEWTSCPWCYAGRLEGNGRKPRPDPRAERRCRRRDCDGELRPFMRYCPLCKTSVTRPWSAEGLERCRSCRWPVAAAWRFCPWCARRQADRGVPGARNSTGGR